MRSVIQRVSHASVVIDDETYSTIEEGILILLGIEERDTFEDIEWLSRKIYQLRIFDDEQGVMNKSLGDINGQVLVVSQFTLHASTKKGNRPSYIKAARPDAAIPLYEQFIQHFEKISGTEVKTGKFGAMMNVTLENNGPVTILIDTKNKE